jgi:hypothetical protein
MKDLKNKTQRPVRIALGHGKVLHLGPGKTAQISDQSTESKAVRDLIAAGTIEILGEGSGGSEAAPEKGTSIRESTHGHPQPTVVTPKGNR